METCCFAIFCFVLFASAASFSIPEKFPEHANGSLQEVAFTSECPCLDGKCVTDSRGKVKCVCKPGYALQDEFTCKPCDCGKKGKCLFTLSPKSRGGFTYEKKCVCDVGSAEKDGKCIDCYCGENSACEFHGEEKNCYCIEGYTEKDGVCSKCDCGFYGKCEFNRGVKQCTCDEGFLELKGVCEECDCGEHGHCSFSEGAKICKCDGGYENNEGVCTECDCGNNAVGCHFSKGEKICQCKDGFADKSGVCAECDCGPNSKSCSFYKNEKKCVCAEGYVLKGSTCKVGCGVDNLCHNGGKCVNGFCNCFRGTSGDFCEVIDACDYLCPKQQDISCAYDMYRQKAFCKCLDSKLRFNPENAQCQRPCEEGGVCRNGGTCTRMENDNSFCRCREGTEGDFCELIPECGRLDCGSDADCLYDVGRGKAACLCRDAHLSFDTRERRCKRECDEGETCKNGGTCARTEDNSFCVCRNGTEGDFCERITECSRMHCGTEANCAYDVTEGRAVCQCKDRHLSFHAQDKKCKSTCNEDAQCKNSARCRGSTKSKFCECLDGTEGHFCENVVGCAEKDCGKDAGCSYDVTIRGAVCLCRDSSKKFDERSKKCKRTCYVDSDCRNGGKCVEGFCGCLAGTSGDACENVPECDTKDCGPDAKCTYSLKRQSAVCECVDERYAFDEADRTCKRGCTADTDCSNGGNCRRKGYHAFCDCLPGTAGDSCEVVEDCVKGRTRCKGNAYCVFDKQTLKGTCRCGEDRKRYDVLEEKCKLTCSEDASCHNGGLCLHRGEDLFCECKVGTSGDLCDRVDDCQGGLCGSEDCVYDAVKEEAVCRCRSDQQLFDPVSKTCKACDCGKSAISCQFKDGKKVCVCRDGYEARNGTCQKVVCTERHCQNGKCQVVGDDEVCSCYEGYELEGDYCRKLNCSKTPCLNGTCVVRHGNREECICQAGHTLQDGVCIRGACMIGTCFGGYCDVIDGELMCVCPKNYSLQGIGCFATVCRKQHCFGGWCVVNEDKEEICTCHEGYLLVNDVCKKILCKRPCFGGQCQFVDGKEECICPEGFSIFEGVCRDNRALQ